jgi:hypothetical protein
VPTATPTDDSSWPSSVWKTVVPQTGQNRNVNLAPWSPTRTYSVAVPRTLYGAAKLAKAAKTLPVRADRLGSDKRRLRVALLELQCAAGRRNKRLFENAFGTSLDIARAA